MSSAAVTRRLSGFYFAYFAVVGAFMPYWSLYLEHQGFNRATIGLLASITVVTRIVAPLAWGWLADRSGKRMRWVRLATLMECLVWLSIFLMPNTLGYLIGVMVVFGFFQNAILAQFEAVTLFWLGRQDKIHYGQVRRWGSLGFIAAVFALGLVFEQVSIGYLPAVLLLITLLTWLWSWQIQEPAHAPRAQQRLQSIVPVLKKSPVWRFFCIEFLLLLSHAPFYSFYSNYLTDFGYRSQTIGLLWGLGVLAEIVMFSQSHFFLRRFSQTQLIALCLLLTAVRWSLVAACAEQFSVQLLAQCLHAFSFGLFHVLAMQVLGRHFAAEQQGRAQAVYSIIWGMGVAIGSVAGGYYWQAIGGSLLFFVAAAVALLGLLLLADHGWPVALWRKRHHP